MNRAEVMDSPELAAYGTVDLISPKRKSEDDGITSNEALMSRIDMSESISTKDWAHYIAMQDEDDPLEPLDADDSLPSHRFKKARLMQSFAFGLYAAPSASGDPEVADGRGIAMKDFCSVQGLAFAFVPRLVGRRIA